MSLQRIVLVFAAVCGLTACPDPPPPGDDLVVVKCYCRDTCAAFRFSINGEICTDSSDADSLDQAKAFICDKKETTGVGIECKIEDCVPESAELILGGCPADNGDYDSGDFAQATASAVPPSVVHVGGDDIIDFSISPEEFIVTTTQTGSALFFGSLVGSLGMTEFESDGIFLNANHTLSEGRISGEPFTVTLEPDGTFAIPPGTGNFIVTGKIDGDRLSLTITTLDLQGQYDEELGIFTLEGTVQAEGADISLSVDLVLEFLNRPPRADAGPDQTAECDDLQQAGIVHLSGSGSRDLEGDSDIGRFSWFVDAGPEVAVGPEVDVPIALGEHEVTLAVADQAGSFGTDTAIVQIEDTREPTITILEPRPAEYAHSETIVLAYEVADGCSGVAGFIATIDGAATLAGHGLENDQTIHLLTELALGPHTFTLDATDELGNAGATSVTFTIVVTPESIADAVRQFTDSGAIRSPGLADALLAQLQAAASARAAGRCDTAARIYRAFVAALEAQRGRGVESDAASILIGDAEFLIADCP